MSDAPTATLSTRVDAGLGPSSYVATEKVAQQHIPLWDPLRNPLFRRLWSANALSNMGTWMQGMGAAWIMATMTQAPGMVAMVQTAMALPIFVLAIPAGVIADRCDRPTYLFLISLATMTVATITALLTSLDLIGPWSLLVLVGMLGAGSALTMPAWQAAVSIVVAPEQISNAATLNGLSFNLARAIGPALAGFVIAVMGTSGAFWLNAVSFTGLVIVYWSWKNSPRSRIQERRLSFSAALKEGFQTAFGSSPFVLLMTSTFFCFASASSLFSLLPAWLAVSRAETSVGAGSIMGAVGLGAVAGAFILPRLRNALTRNGLLVAGWGTLGGATILIPFTEHSVILFLVACCAGSSWAVIVSTLNSTSQSMFAPSVRARTLSIYLMAMYGGSTTGSLFWGWVAETSGMPSAFALAGLALLFMAFVQALISYGHRH